MTTLQSPTRAILFPSPSFLVPNLFPFFFPQKPPDSHPPTLWKSFFCGLIARNKHGINSLHFSNVNESVTANPVFCPIFGPKGGLYGQKGPHFGVF
jgi:hypothetical protein